MSKLQNTINESSVGLFKHGIIDKKTLKDLTDCAEFDLNIYTGEEIQAIREREGLSQPVFAKYLNISDKMVKSLEQGSRRAQGAILKLLNIVDHKGIDGLS